VNIHRFLFYLLLVLLPIQLTKHFFPEFAFISGIRVDYLAPTIYVTDILVVALLLTSIRKLLKIPSTALCLFFVGVAVNIVFAINPFVAFFKWLTIFEVVFVCFYIVVEKPSPKPSSIFLIVGGLYSSLLAWMQFIQQSSIGGIFWWIGERTFSVMTPGIARTAFDNQLFLRPYATFPHPNVLAGFLTCLVPLVFYAKNYTKYSRLLFVPTLILFLATIFITFSQSAWVLATITTFIFLLQEKGISLTKPYAVAGLFMLTIVFSVFSYQFVETESISRRIALNTDAISLFQTSPIVGVGLNNFIVANQENKTINSYQDLQPAHSIYLLLLSETGIVGVVMVLTIVFLVLKKAKINNDSVYVIWSLGILLIFGVLDHYPFTIHQTLLFFGILTGFILLASRAVINLRHGKRSK
jgi:O-antigen ligase